MTLKRKHGLFFRSSGWPCKISRFLKQLKVKLFPNGSSHPASQIQTDLPPAAQIWCWLLPSLQKHKKQQTNVGGWALRRGKGQLREAWPQQHRQPLVQPPTPDSTDLKTLTKLGVTSTSLRSSSQLNAAKEQQKDLCNILQRASVTLHIILLGVGGTIYNTHNLKPFKELGLDSQRVKKLASKLHVHSMNFATKLVHTRCALSRAEYCYQLSSRAGFRPSLQPSWSPLIFPSFLRWRSFTVLGTNVAHFP